MFRRCILVCLYSLLVLWLFGMAAEENPKPESEKPPAAKIEPVLKDRYGDPLPPGAVARFEKVNTRSGVFWRALAFSPDSRILVGCGWGEKATSQIVFWNVKADKVIRTWREPRRRTQAIAFTPDGKTLGSASADNTLLLWDIPTEDTFVAKRGPISNSLGNRCHLAFSSDGRSFATPDMTAVYKGIGGIRLSETISGEERAEIHVCNGQTESELCFNFSPNFRLLAVGTDRGKVYLIDLATEAVLWKFEDIRFSQAYQLFFSPDGTTLLAAGLASGETGKEKPLRVLDVASGKEQFGFRGHDRSVIKAALSPDGSVVALLDGDFLNRVSLWDVKTGRELTNLAGHEGKITAFAFSPDGKYLATTSGYEHSILLWDLAIVPGIKRTLPPKRTRIVQICENPKEPLPDGKVEKWWDDLAGKDAKKAYRAMWSLALHPEQSLPFLRTHLHPQKAPTPERLKRLLANLDSDQFAERERASVDLEQLNDLAASAMKKALADKPSLEMRRRLEPLLAKLKRPYTSAERLRTLRALEALEHIGNDDAKKILHTMADGAPGTAETEDAKASLKRLDARR